LESETFCWWKGQFVGEGPQEELDEGLRVPRALGTLVDSLVCCTGGTMSLTWASGAGESQWPGALLVMGGSMGVVSYAVGWAFRWRSGLLSSSILTWTICMGIWALWDWVNYAEVVGLTAFAFSCATLHMVLLKSALTNSPPLLYALLFILVTVSIPSVASVVDEDTSTAVIVIFCLLLAWLEALIVSTHTRLMVWHLQRGRVSLREVSRTAEDEAASCKKSFAVQVLHDVGTPLAMFALGVESIKTVSTLGAEHLETLRTLDCAIELMTLTRRKAIDFAQSMSGKPLVMRLGSTDVRDLVECKCRRIMSGFNTSHRVPIYYQVDRDVANYIITDGNVLWECLLNYLSNAVKFTNKGEIQCNVYRVTAATLRFEVRDTGIGIDHGARHRLFIPFVQLHQFGGGLGLGLWSVKQKITALHGSVGLHDTPGGGTTFFFDVPYKPDFVLERAMEDMKVSSIPEVDPVPDSSSVKAIGMTPTGADSATEQYLHPALAMKRRRVLVVDGRPLAYKCAHKLLVDKGFQVDYASNGRQGLLKMQQRIYTAVLVDCSITVRMAYCLAACIGIHLTANSLPSKPRCALLASAF
jgi:signal transduction histidine kinase